MQRFLPFLILCLLGFDLFAEDFTPPNAALRRTAIGSMNGLDATQRKLFAPGFFSPITPPAANDWLANHKERGQTWRQFSGMRPNRPDGKRKIIYVLPLGEFPFAKKVILDEMAEFGPAFFGLDMKVLPGEAIDKSFTTRINGFTKNKQILTRDVLRHLKKKLPKDAYCLIAVSMTDLYPDEKWNYVFGQASLRDRVGVYSFSRYDPEFPRGKPGAKVTPLFLHRCLKVFAHETGHMFGMAHCIYFDCLMNGSNHLEESDRQPIHLCPICLRKMAWSTQFDPIPRYRGLYIYYRKAGLEAPRAWMEKRLDTLNQELPSVDQPSILPGKAGE